MGRDNVYRLILRMKESEQWFKYVLVIDVMALYSNVSLVVAGEEHLSTEDSRVFPCEIGR